MGTLRLSNSMIVLAAALLAAAPACATKDLSLHNPAVFTSGVDTSGVRQDAAVARRDKVGPNKKGDMRESRLSAAAQEPTGWLMILVGFGLLGILTRRGTPHPLQETQIA
jgi:hypothetical protein